MGWLRMTRPSHTAAHIVTVVLLVWAALLWVITS